MAPEVILLSGANTKSDIWSLGCTVVELLTGNPPYFDLGPMQALFNIVEDKHPPIPSNLSKETNHFLSYCFTKDPKKRFTADVLLQHPWIQSAQGPSLLTMKFTTSSKSIISPVYPLMENQKIKIILYYQKKKAKIYLLSMISSLKKIRVITVKWNY